MCLYFIPCLPHPRSKPSTVRPGDGRRGTGRGVFFFFIPEFRCSSSSLLAKQRGFFLGTTNLELWRVGGLGV